MSAKGKSGLDALAGHPLAQVNALTNPNPSTDQDFTETPNETDQDAGTIEATGTPVQPQPVKPVYGGGLIIEGSLIKPSTDQEDDQEDQDATNTIDGSIDDIEYEDDVDEDDDAALVGSVFYQEDMLILVVEDEDPHLTKCLVFDVKNPETFDALADDRLSEDQIVSCLYEINETLLVHVVEDLLPQYLRDEPVSGPRIRPEDREKVFLDLQAVRPSLLVESMKRCAPKAQEEDAQETQTQETDLSEQDEAELLRQILAFEPDELRRPALEKLAKSLDLQKRVALLESLKLTNGPTETFVEIASTVDNLIKRARESKALQARNKLNMEFLDHYDALFARMSSVLRDPLRDTMLASIKSSGVREHISTLTEQLNTLAGGIYSMESIILGTDGKRDFDQPVDVVHLLRVMTVIAYGVKTWAETYVVAQKQITEQEALIKHLMDKLKEANDDHETLMKRLQTSENAYKRAQIAARSGSFVLTTDTGRFVTSTFMEDEDGEVFFSPAATGFTRSMDEAVEFQTIEAAQTVLDAMKRWYKNKRVFRNKMKEIYLKPENFHIASLMLTKIGG